MENVDKQIALIYNTKTGNSSRELIEYMIKKVLRNQTSKDMDDGRLYFATDYEAEPDFGANPETDIILFENVENEDIHKALRMAEKTAKGARILIPLEDDFIESARMSLTVTRFTYSLNDVRANLCANKITPLKGGGFEAEVVYQSSPQRKTLRDRIFPTYNRNMFGKFKVNSTEMDDVLHTIKAFGFGLMLSIETKYITEAISSFVFESMRDRPWKEIFPPKAVPGAAREEKEFDED